MARTCADCGRPIGSMESCMCLYDEKKPKPQLREISAREATEMLRNKKPKDPIEEMLEEKINEILDARESEVPMLKQRGYNTPDFKQDLARASIRPGMTLYGYCNGEFGRDSYGDKIVVEVGFRHLLVREPGGELNTANDVNWVELIKSSNRALEDENERSG